MHPSFRSKHFQWNPNNKLSCCHEVNPTASSYLHNEEEAFSHFYTFNVGILVSQLLSNPSLVNISKLLSRWKLKHMVE